MNYAQRWLVIATLVSAGVVLAFVFLVPVRSGSIFLDDIKIIDVPGSEYRIDAINGIPGFLLGLIAPLCLFAGAAFIALGTKTKK